MCSTLELGSKCLLRFSILSAFWLYMLSLIPWSIPDVMHAERAYVTVPLQSWVPKGSQLAELFTFFPPHSHSFLLAGFRHNSSVTLVGFFRKCSSQRFSGCPPADRTRILLFVFYSSTDWVFFPSGCFW